MSKAYTADKGLGLICVALANIGGCGTKRELVIEMLKLRGKDASTWRSRRGCYEAYFGNPKRAPNYFYRPVTDYFNGVYYTRPQRGFYRLTPAGEKLVKALREDCASC